MALCFLSSRITWLKAIRDASSMQTWTNSQPMPRWRLTTPVFRPVMRCPTPAHAAAAERRYARLLRSLRLARPRSNDVRLIFHGTPLVRKSSACEMSQSTVTRGRLDLTPEQWVFIFIGTPFCVALYMIPDIYLINKHFRPIGVALSRLDRVVPPSLAEAYAAVYRGLDLPPPSFLRIRFD